MMASEASSNELPGLQQHPKILTEEANHARGRALLHHLPRVQARDHTGNSL